jgi:DNA-binding transcriptional regulator LsrR (DeoR family)
MARAVTGESLGRTDEDGLAIRAAWLHFAGGLTQAQVAGRLGISSAKAHRLVTQASQSGAVKVTIDGSISECVALEQKLAARFDLTTSEVVPDLHEEGLPLRALGRAGASFLRREIQLLQEGTIGIGHGRTLAAAIQALPQTTAGKVSFVSLLGGFTRNYAANPHDVIHSLASKTMADAYVLPLPFFADSVEDRKVFMAQRGARSVMDRAACADLMVAGIGTVDLDTQLVTSRMVEPDEIEDVQARGGQGELLGHFFDREGHAIRTSLSDRTLSLDLEVLRGRRIVALAGGPGKVAGIRAVLHSGFLNGLITDERTAMALLDQEQGKS